MKNVSFSAKVATFVNWYFSFEQVDENETDVFNALKKHLNETAYFEIVPDKMTSFVIISVGKEVYRLELCESDDFVNSLACEHVQLWKYKGVMISTARIGSTILYCAPVWVNYPNYLVYCATYDDMKKQIDFATK